MVFNLLNIQFMELSPLVQLIWVQAKDNQYWVDSQIFPRKEQMKRDLNNKQRDTDFRQEELEDNTHQWIKKVQLTFLQWQDLGLHKLMLHRNFIMDLLNYIRLKMEIIQMIT